MKIKGTSGDDVINGTQGNDVIDASQGGNDTINAGDGHDQIFMGAAFTAQDSIDGGAGNDSVVLKGDYTGANAVTFLATTMINVESLSLVGRHSYALTTNDATVALGSTLTVDASTLGTGDALTFNGAAETDGHFFISAGAGNDTLTGGMQGDIFDLSRGGNDVANGGGGDDFFDLGGALTAADRIDGGPGNNTVLLNGDYSAGLLLAGSTLVNIETIDLAAGHSYSITASDGTLSGTNRLTVNGSTLGAGDNLTFDASAESAGSYYFYGGAGLNVVTGGAGDNTFDLAGNLTAADRIDGGGGHNNILILNGDYSAGLTFAPTTIQNIERIELGGGYSYSLTFDPANVPATIDGSALGPDDSLSLNLSGVPYGQISISTGAGSNHLVGGNESDSFYFENGLSRSDSVDGGGGENTVEITGGTSFVLTPENFTNIQDLIVDTGVSVTARDGAGAAGQTLDVTLHSGANFDGSAETGGHFSFNVDGYSTVEGGALSDTFGLGAGVTASGGKGDDVFTVSASDLPTDHINGGVGEDTLTVYGASGSGPYILADASFTRIETLALDSDTNLVESDGNVGAHKVLNVSVSGNSVTFDGSAETDGTFSFTDSSAYYSSVDNSTLIGGSGNDTFTTNSSYDQNDILDGGPGNDVFNLYGWNGSRYQVNGGSGSDKFGFHGGGASLTLVYSGAGDSTSTNYDTLTKCYLSYGSQIGVKFDVPGTVSAIDPFVDTGSLSRGSFDSDLAADIGAGQLVAYHAVEFRAQDGDLAHQLFLIVDLNGQAGYQAGEDLVVRLSNSVHGELTTANFI
jgi:hypothetical protein